MAIAWAAERSCHWLDGAPDQALLDEKVLPVLMGKLELEDLERGGEAK